MNDTRTQLTDVEQEISAALSDGAHINEDQLMRLMDAFGRHNAKNDKIFNMVHATITNAIDEALKDSGLEYTCENVDGNNTLLSVKLDENLQFECHLSVGSLQKTVSTIRDTIDALQVLRQKSGTFYIRPIYKLR